MDALSTLASDLRVAYRGGQLSLDKAIERLAQGVYDARGQIVRGIRSAVGVDGHRVRHEDIEDAIAEATVGLQRLFEGWTGDGFGPYFVKTARNKLADQHRKTHREELSAAGEVKGVFWAGQPAGKGTVDLWGDVQASNRFVWYIYGSPDNPSRVSSSKSIVDMMALKARLEERPASELVQNCQPRVGEWGPGQGEPDEKWWRNRATYAHKKVIALLDSPEYHAQYERIRSSLRDAR